MEKEKLSDKIKYLLNKDNILSFVYFLVFLLFMIVSKNLLMLLIIFTTVNILQIIYNINYRERGYIKYIWQFYIILSSFSFLFILFNFSNYKIIYLWLLSTVLLVKMTEYFVDKIFFDEGVKKFNLIKFTITSIVVLTTGVIFSLFMKQKLIKFTIVNFVIYLLTYVNYLFPEKYKSNVLVRCFNIIALPIVVISILLLSKIIILK